MAYKTPISIERLIGSPQRRGATQRRYRFRTTQDLAPQKFRQETPVQSNIVPEVVMEQNATGMYVPDFPESEGTPASGVDLNVDPVEAEFSTTKGALEDLGLSKAKSLGARAIAAAILGFSPQAAFSAPGPLSLLNAVNVVAPRAYSDYTAQQEVNKAIADRAGVAVSDLTPEMKAEGIAAAKSAQINDPQGYLGGTYDEAKVKSRHYDQPITSIAYQGMKDFVPEAIAGPLGIEQSPAPGSGIAARDVYGAFQPGLGFEAVDPASVGVNDYGTYSAETGFQGAEDMLGSVDLSTVGEGINLADLAAPKTEEQRILANKLAAKGGGGISGSKGYGSYSPVTGFRGAEHMIGSVDLSTLGPQSGKSPGSYSTSRGSSYTTEGMAPGQSINTSSITDESMGRNLGGGKN